MSRCFKPLFVALSLCLALGLTVSAQAQDGKLLTEEEALIQDAQPYAERFGVSLDEALRRLEVQRSIGKLAADLHSDPDFAGMWIEHAPEFKVVTRFVDSATGRRAVETARPRLAGTAIQLLPAEYRLVDLEEAKTKAGFVTRKVGVAADLDIDVRTNRVVLSVLDTMELATALDSSRFALPEGVIIEQVPELAVDEAAVYAGLDLTTCTMGFTVRNAGGTTGVLTSGHCGNTQSHGGRNLPFQGQCHSGSEDVQWHDDTIYHYTWPWTRAGNTTRTVNGTRTRTAQAVGTWVCKHGKTSGFTCGTIDSISFLPSTQPSGNATFVRVEGGSTDLSSGGDSGGPWFVGNDAYGVHKCGIGNDSCYMPINFVDCLGVTLLLYTPPPPRTCEDDCHYDHAECEEDFCYWDYDEYMCNEGCDEELDYCLADC